MAKDKFIPINEFVDRFKKIKRRSFIFWFDKITFWQILFVWLIIILGVGLFYHFSATDTSFLRYSVQKQPVTNIWDSIYFSFVAFTNGFSDITPLGFYKIISVIEVVAGLLLIAFIVSKIVSIKQDIILSEIYEISFNERMNRLRNSMLLFRQNLSRVMDKIESNLIKKREINDIYIYLSSFEDSLTEFVLLIDGTGKSHFKKNLDSLNAELILISALHSFEKINETASMLNERKLEWKREITLSIINKSLSQINEIFTKLSATNILKQARLLDLASQKDRLVSSIKANL